MITGENNDTEMIERKMKEPHNDEKKFPKSETGTQNPQIIGIQFFWNGNRITELKVRMANINRIGTLIFPLNRKGIMANERM